MKVRLLLCKGSSKAINNGSCIILKLFSTNKITRMSLKFSLEVLSIFFSLKDGTEKYLIQFSYLQIVFKIQWQTPALLFIDHFCNKFLNHSTISVESRSLAVLFIIECVFIFVAGTNLNCFHFQNIRKLIYIKKTIL